MATLSALIMVAPSVLAGGSSVGMGPHPADSVNISSRAMPMTSLTSACSGVPEIGVPFLCDTPGVSQIPVPAGATEAEVVVIGGGGGGGSDGARGGHGAEVTATVSLTGIESLLITVASGGGGSIFSGDSNPNPIKGGSSGGGTVGQFGTYGAAANVTADDAPGLGWTGGAAGGGMSAIADGTGKADGSAMAMDDLLIIAGGGGGGALRGSGAGGDGAAGTIADYTAAGGDGVSDGVNVAAEGGSGGIGGNGAGGGAGLNPGSKGEDFPGIGDPSPWGAGGEGASSQIGSSGGAGYGGGGGASNGALGSAAAGGSFALAARAIGVVAFAPSDNGGLTATTGGARGGDGGNGSVQITFLGPDTSAPWTLIHQSLPLGDSGTCEGLDDEFAAYGTGIRGGWVRSWEPWVNQTLGANGERIGGWACSRVLVNRGGTAWSVMD